MAANLNIHKRIAIVVTCALHALTLPYRSNCRKSTMTTYVLRYASSTYVMRVHIYTFLFSDILTFVLIAHEVTNAFIKVHVKEKLTPHSHPTYIIQNTSFRRQSCELLFLLVINFPHKMG